MHPPQEAVSRVIDELRLLFAAHGGRNLTVSQLRMMLQQHAQQHGAQGQGQGQGRPGAAAGGAVGQGVVANLQVRSLVTLYCPRAALAAHLTPDYTRSTRAMPSTACRRRSRRRCASWPPRAPCSTWNAPKPSSSAGS